MDDAGQEDNNIPQSSPNQSYVYPIRSLFSGVQLATQSEQVMRMPQADASLVAQVRSTSTDLTSVPYNARSSSSSRDHSYFPPFQESSSSSQVSSNNLPIALLSPQAERHSLFNQGFVHLAPASSEDSNSRGSRTANSAPHTSDDASASHSDDSGYAADPDPEQKRTDPSPAGSAAMTHSSAGSSAVSVHSTAPEEFVSFRFEHVQTAEGHHVVTGRGGKIAKCEDEPIRVPGAVQGFGVLIVLEEDVTSGNLVVRQVSENSTDILGLSPSYLFSLSCFTHVLPENQSDILWGNIESLAEDDSESDATGDESPQVFLLRGWGEPETRVENSESAISTSESSDHAYSSAESSTAEAKLVRRVWTCWCAIHRPPVKAAVPSSSSSTNTPLDPVNSRIVLEFELERDSLNPLYQNLSTNKNSKNFGASPTSSSDALSAGTPGSDSTARAGSSGSMVMPSIEETTTPLGEQSSPVTPSVLQHQVVSSPSHFSGSSASTPSLSSGTTTTSAGQESSASSNPGIQGLVGDDGWYPSARDVYESTTNRAKPLRALERMRNANRRMEHRSIQQRLSDSSGTPSRPSGPKRRKSHRASGVGTMDVFSVLAQVNDQLGAASSLEEFLKIVVGVVKDLTQFHRVLIYQFDEQWNGQVVAELVDWDQTHDLYNSLHFPASDIPAQARELYVINKVRLLYDRDQPTARLVVRNKSDLETPLDMTHSFLRAMSPIHIKYLANMGVRASMSVSIVTFGALWGLIACHSYGDAGMRVSFPVRQMLRLLSDSVSRNIERLSYAQRLHTRKLISTLPTDQHPTGYIIANAEDLLGLFDADFGVLVIGAGAKILGPNQHGQEILIISEYLRLKEFKLMQVSHSLERDFPDLQLPSGGNNIAGLLYVPLTSRGQDFIAFLRKGQLREVQWAGKPFKHQSEDGAFLEPRKSFKMWSETISGRCRGWTDEQLETAGVLSLVYGKFIEVWRQKESALQSNQLTKILLSNASHEVRTPLNHIINYLEMALNGPLDSETRENLVRSHTASKGLLFTINDLLDLTRLESGNETSFNEPFNLPETIQEAVQHYSMEARRRDIEFKLDIKEAPTMVVGDARKIRTIVANLAANAVKFTSHGSVTVECRHYHEPRGLRSEHEVAVELVVADTGCGMTNEKLESIFREFEQVESSTTAKAGEESISLGLGLAVVARVVGQLGGQLRVHSKIDEGSRFSFLIPFVTAPEKSPTSSGSSKAPLYHQMATRVESDGEQSAGSRGSEIESLVEALGQSHMVEGNVYLPMSAQSSVRARKKKSSLSANGTFYVEGSNFAVHGLKMDDFDVDKVPATVPRPMPPPPPPSGASAFSTTASARPKMARSLSSDGKVKLRVVIVEDDPINRNILSKRLRVDGHEVLTAVNGQEGVELIEKDRAFDVILMDIQMPILNGFEATERIRQLERDSSTANDDSTRQSVKLNGRIPIFAVSASLQESQRENMFNLGMDGWILKPIDFKRLRIILQGITVTTQRISDLYTPGCSWEAGGWLHPPSAASSPRGK